jgi:nitroimidazol reductase NimA-like FMN-containing flavoprotein (pyridoxamine 5'-phosphate oxidase superfamily)
MEFNKITRGAKRAVYDEAAVYAVLDAGFLCHVAFQHNGVPMMIPTAYGRAGDRLYLHGSVKSMMLNEIIKGATICIAVTHLDGIVLAKSLFDTSANYRSVVLFGKATVVTDEEERIEGLRVITEQIIPGRWDEVPVGSPTELKATMVVKFTIETASVKIRDCGPQGDEDKPSDIWSGHIPLQLKALEPVTDLKFGNEPALSASVENFWKSHGL